MNILTKSKLFYLMNSDHTLTLISFTKVIQLYEFSTKIDVMKYFVKYIKQMRSSHGSTSTKINIQIFMVKI